MTLVNAETGEIVERSITLEDARQLTDEIKAALNVSWDLIAEAYQTRAWEPLQYPSWDDYCEGEFRGARLRLPAEDRREVVASMRDSGMSTRATAAALGVSKSTVADDLASGVQNRTPAGAANAAPDVSTMVDNDRPAASEGVSAGSPPPQPAPPVPVTGLDGKSYPKKPPRERPPALTEDELQAKEEADAVNRYVVFIKDVLDGWTYFRTVQRDAEWRRLVLAQMAASDVTALKALEMEVGK